MVYNDVNGLIAGRMEWLEKSKIELSDRLELRHENVRANPNRSHCVPIWVIHDAIILANGTTHLLRL